MPAARSYVADQVNNKVRKVTQCGQVSSLTGAPNTAMTAIANSGNGGPLAAATFSSPYGITADPKSNVLYVFEQGGSVVRAITLPSATLTPTCDGSWHHIAQTFSGGANPQTSRTFMDGALMSQTLVTVDVSGGNSTPVFIGASGESTRPLSFAGSVSDVRIFNRVLTCDEAVALSLPPLVLAAGTLASPAVITAGISSTSVYCAISWAGPYVTYGKNADNSWSYTPTPPSCTQCSLYQYADQTAGVCAGMAATTCGALPTYLLGGGSTQGCCLSPATVLSTSGAACAPNPAFASLAGPVDTAFALSGSAAEGLGGVAPSPSNLGFVTDRFGAAKGALLVGAGGSVQASGAALSAALPAPGSANGATVSANVKCTLDPASVANMTVVEWAAPTSVNDPGARLALVVTGVANVPALSGVTTTPTTAITSPRQGVFDRSGNFYITQGNYLGVIAVSTGVYRVLLGSGTAARVDGVGTNAQLNAPAGITLSQDGFTVYWSEPTSYVIRMADVRTLQTSTLAGFGGSAYNEGVGTQAGFMAPNGIDIDYARNILYVADGTNYRVRAINLQTRQTSTLTGSGTAGYVDGPASACTINQPYGLAVQQASGNVFVTDISSNKIRMVTPQGTCSTYAALSGASVAGAKDAQGTNAQFNQPRGLAFDASGYLYVADTTNNKIRRVSPNGLVISVTGVANTASASSTTGTTGNGLPLASVQLGAPYDVKVDPASGALWVLENTGSNARTIALSAAPSALLPVCDGSWHAIATTFSGGANPQTVRTYVDGYPAATSSLTIATTGTASSPLVIGASGELGAAAPPPYAGLISDVRVYARALSAAEALSLSQPVVPVFPGVLSSPARGVGVTRFAYSCPPGFAGSSLQTFVQQADLSWAFGISGTPTCSICPAMTYSAVTASASVCTSCATISASAVSAAGSQYCVCANNTFQTGSPTAFTCTACPTGSTASGGPASCTCNENFVAVNSGASLSCVCPAGYAQSGAGAQSTCVLLSATPSPTATPTPTPTSTPTPSITPSPTSTASFTSTSTLTATPSVTASATPTPSGSITPSQTSTPSNTPTPSQTPSVTTVPDVLLYFAVNLVPLQGGLTVNNVASLPAFLRSSAASFAALINVPAAQVYAVNVSDLATGAFAVVGSVRRQLGASAGSNGVAVTYVVRLGKTPVQSDVANISAVLSSPTLAASTLRAVAVQLGAATQLGAAAYALAVPASGVALKNAPFALGATVIVASAAAADTSGTTGGAAAGGIVGAIALACCVWARRSYNKHKK